MAEEIETPTNPQEGGAPAEGGGSQPTEGNGGDDKVSKLEEQVDNLTKGIASYRDDTKNLKTQLSEALGTIEELKKGKEEESSPELSPEDEEKFEAIAKKKGFVRQEDLEKKEQQQHAEQLQQVEVDAINDFIEKYPQYNTDEEWEKVKAEFSLYKTPQNRKQFDEILNRIHRDLSSGNERSQGRAEGRAESYNTDHLSVGGGSQQGGSSEGGEDLDALREKYPNLSDDQIRETLRELNTLTSDKEEEKK